MGDNIITSAGMRIIRLLVGKPPQTVGDLIKILRVTRTAITEQLNELAAGGYVERTIERLPGRGRPRHLYKTTNAALLLLFANHQRMVVPAIWQAVEDIGGEELRRRVLRRVSANIAEYYKRKITAHRPADRLRQMCAILSQDGALVDVEGDGEHLVIHKRSCGFFSMYEPKRAICTVDEMLMSDVVGRPVRQVSSRHDGAPCCVFEIVPEKGSHDR
jgi:predicted ArsR family transcriptional regulator